MAIIRSLSGHPIKGYIRTNTSDVVELKKDSSYGVFLANRLNTISYFDSF